MYVVEHRGVRISAVVAVQLRLQFGPPAVAHQELDVAGHVAFEPVVAVEALELQLVTQLLADGESPSFSSSLMLNVIMRNMSRMSSTRSQSRLDSSVRKPATSRQYSPVKPDSMTRARFSW